MYRSASIDWPHFAAEDPHGGDPTAGGRHGKPTRARAPRALSVLALGAVGVLGLAGCTAGGTAGGASSSSVLSVAASAAITTWDPVRSFRPKPSTWATSTNPCSGKTPKVQQNSIPPAIAESWRRNDDGKSWTFKIRSGATFHDGEPVNAAAVKASIDAAKDHAAASFIWAPVESDHAPLTNRPSR